MVESTVRTYLWLSFMLKLGMSFTFATYVLFLRSRGLDLFEVNLVNTVFFLTMFVAEIPTGLIADVFGRRVSLICACVLYAGGMFAYAAATSFVGCAVAEATIAIGATCVTGAFQSWFVDRLRHQGFEGSTQHLFSRCEQVEYGTSIFGAVMGAWLASYHNALPWIAGGAVFAVTAVLAMAFMKEEYFVSRRHTLRGGVRHLKRTAVVGMASAARLPEVRHVMLLSTLLTLGVMAPNMQWQPLFEQYLGKENEAAFGPIFAGVNVMLLIGARLAPRMLNWCKNERMALAFTQMMVGVWIALTVLMPTFALTMGAYLIHEVGRGAWRIIKNAYLNDAIPANRSRRRSTILSFEAQIRHIGGVFGLVGGGYLAKSLSITPTWIVSGLVLVISAVVLIRNGKHN